MIFLGVDDDGIIRGFNMSPYQVREGGRASNVKYWLYCGIIFYCCHIFRKNI